MRVATIHFELSSDDQELCEDHLEWMTQQIIDIANMCGLSVCGGWDLGPDDVTQEAFEAIHGRPPSTRAN